MTIWNRDSRSSSLLQIIVDQKKSEQNFFEQIFKLYSYTDDQKQRKNIFVFILNAFHNSAFFFIYLFIYVCFLSIFWHRYVNETNGKYVHLSKSSSETTEEKEKINYNN